MFFLGGQVCEWSSKIDYRAIFFFLYPVDFTVLISTDQHCFVFFIPRRSYGTDKC